MRMDEDEYVRRFSELVELEREEQMRFHEEEMRRLSGKEREERGRAYLMMRGRSEGLGLGGKYLVKFKKKNSTQLPESEIEVGDLVIVSPRGRAPWDKRNPTGTVSAKTSYSITVAFDDPFPRSFLRENLRIDLFVNDITFRRMLEALNHFKKISDDKKRKILGDRPPEFDKGIDLEFLNEKLNESQREAVLKSLQARDFFLIHGPPGTGKTMTSVEVIAQIVRKGGKVLASADSNVAVDNLVEYLDRIGLEVVRIGHPARIIPSLRRRSLDYIVQEDLEYKKVIKLRDEAYGIKEKMQRHVLPEMKWRRGLGDDEIIRLAREGRTTRGIPKEKIQGMKRWIDLKRKADELFSQARRIEEGIIKRIIERADVICTTNSTAGSEILGGKRFDVAVIDEATQATEPSTLIPLLKADRFIMAGDHMQLPPTVINEEAARKGLSMSMFERLLHVHGDKIRVMLEVQYRMNEEIAEFSNNEFYGGRLKADESVKDHTLADLIDADLSEEDIKPLIFIDTAGKDGFSERRRKGSTSIENPGEARLVREIVKHMLELGMKPVEIAVISPYEDQVALIRRMVQVDGLEIKTVDGFQGREKEIVIVSFVRSNRSGDIGFLRDLRRLNVSLTRAKRKLILIGDSETLRSDGCYRNLIDLVKRRNGYRKLG